MAHSEFVAETTPLASEPGLRCASETSTKRTTDAASETAHHASLDSRSLNDRIARPFCKQVSKGDRSLAHLSANNKKIARGTPSPQRAK